MDWQTFIVVGLLLSALEIFTPGFVLLPIGLAFLVTGVVAIWIPGHPAQWLTLAVSLAVVFLVLKGPFLRKYKQGKTLKSNVDHLIGKMGIVEEDIFGHQGYIKVYGDSWKARSSDKEPISKGQSVIVERMEGITVYVRKV